MIFFSLWVNHWILTVEKYFIYLFFFSDGKCVIFPKCKQHCKKCRFDKCLAIGMDPKWVLSNDEKRIRFKNYFKKKDEKAQQPSASTSEDRETTSATTTTTKRRRYRGQHPYQSSRETNRQTEPEMVAAQSPR